MMPDSEGQSVTAASRGGRSDCPDLIHQTFGDRSEEACAVAWCESRYQPEALGDINAQGEAQSLGLFQLWRGWAPWAGYQPEQLLDPAINVRVALKVLEHRGRWGGAGGWTCADLGGIH
jgi:soluble lytic murein transglycosylase-like protein